MSRTFGSAARRLALAALAGLALGACEDGRDALGPAADAPRFSHINYDALDTVLVTGQITGTRVFRQDTIYLLRDLVTVESGGVLQIQEGTRILGDAGQIPTALIVEQGGRIEANGTAEHPIVFTSSRPAGQRAPGDWGGIVLIGDAPANCAGLARCQTEGLDSAYTYGGADAADNSGTLRYVRIEFVGRVIAEGDELNGLTLYGVGSGTTIDHVQVHSGLDDGIEIFGGTVDIKYALATRITDDSFDYSTGWAGRGQFWIAQQADSADKGFEVDNSEFDFEADPLTDPQIYNVTLVGLKTGASDGTLLAGNDGLHLRRGTGGRLLNFVVLGFRGAGLDVDDPATFTECSAGNLAVSNGIFFSDNEGTFDPDADTETSCTGAGIQTINPSLVAPFDRTDPDFRPSSALSPAQSNFAQPPNDGFFTTPVDFRGAIGFGDAEWYQGWTTFAAN